MRKTKILNIFLSLMMLSTLLNCQNVTPTNVKSVNTFNDKYMYPDDDGDGYEPLEEACDEGHPGACETLAQINDKRGKPTPKPTSSPEPDCSNLNGKILTPTLLPDVSGFTFTGSSFRTQGFRPDNMAESINHLADVLQRIKVLQVKYDDLNQKGDISGRDAVNTELQGNISERNRIKPDILTGLDNYKNYLRNQVNTLMEDNTFSVDDNYKPVDLYDYKDSISVLEEKFNGRINGVGIYDIVHSINFLADEVEILHQLIDDILNNILVDITVDNTSQITDENNLFSMNSQFEIAKYFSTKITFHKDQINIKSIKLREAFENNVDEQLLNMSVQIGYFSETFFQTLFEKNMINPSTFQLNLSKVQDGNNFSIKDHTSGDSAAEAFIESKKQIGSYINKTDGYVNTAINYWFSPTTIKMSSLLSNITYKAYIKTHPQVIISEKAHNALSNATKTATDYYANALANAVNETEWGLVPPDQQQQRISNYKEVLGDIINVDTLATAGGLTALKLNQLRLRNIAKSVEKASEIAKVQKSKDIAKIDNLLKNVQDPVIKQKLTDMRTQLKQDVKKINNLENELKDLENKNKKLCPNGLCPDVNFDPQTGLYKVIERYRDIDENSGVLKNGVYLKNPSAQSLNEFPIIEGKMHWPPNTPRAGEIVSGELNYVIDKNGNTIIGEPKPFGSNGKTFFHPNLLGGLNPEVEAAGELDIVNGKAVLINNQSGHYHPSSITSNNVINSFENIPKSINYFRYKFK